MTCSLAKIVDQALQMSTMACNDMPTSAKNVDHGMFPTCQWHVKTRKMSTVACQWTCQASQNSTMTCPMTCQASPKCDHGMGQ
ncbi:hypothetical protein DVH24_007899 [Malus domestica]|uniref:Uncharacterized protein n=1 Tax=Malus domestica TaxID=3750 RepID=A0A498KRZ1_MALDO|nr:hypothetical protein DVH24_007899 [Malus domestica]